MDTSPLAPTVTTAVPAGSRFATLLTQSTQIWLAVVAQLPLVMT